jgi:predicted transcriptional regulator of viral defense system
MDFFTLYRELEKYKLEIFTLNDVIKITGQKKEVVKSILTRLVNQKKLFRLKNKYYTLKEIENKFLFQKLFKETYIGLHAALEYYESTTQRFNNLDLITKNILKDQKIKNTQITFHKVKHDLFFGFEKHRVSETDVFISNIEKTIIDCSYFSSKVYISEINSFIIENKKNINTEKLTLYLKKIHSAVLNKRVGYLLERNGISIGDVEINNKYDRLNINLGENGTRDRKWKLIINENL